MLKIKTWRDPYDLGANLIRLKEIELKEGLTVLVGCNGAGKSTLLMNIKECLEKEKIPVHLFNNLYDGGRNSFSSLIAGYNQFDCDSMSLGVTLWSSSEGEAIKLNISRQSTLYKTFFKTGHFKDTMYELHSAFNNELKADVKDNRRVLLFDAVDSGLSVDSVIEIKSLFNFIIEDAKSLGIELYIIISANEYELCRESACFNVNSGQYIYFKDYEDYRKYILKSREIKDKRLAKQLVYSEKEKQKEIEEYNKLKKSVGIGIEKIKNNAKGELTFKEKRAISNLKDKLNDFIRCCRYNSFERF